VRPQAIAPSWACNGQNWREAGLPQAVRAGLGHSQRDAISPAAAPRSCAAMNPGAPAGEIPANVSDMTRATVTAGLAKEVDAVNQYAEVM